MFWEVHWLVARRLVYLWASAYYIGQMSKDVLRLPRPPPAVTIDCTGPSTVLRAWRTPTPKPYGRIDPRLGPNGIVRLERHYETEGGMPSTHSMNAVSMPWLIVSLLVSLSPPSPDASPSAPLSAFHTGLYVIGVLWTVLCISSRLYMGVHSPADIVVGVLIGLAMLALNLAVGGDFDAWVLRGAAAATATATAASPSSLVTPFLPSALVARLAQAGDVDVFVLSLVVAILLALVYPRFKTPRWISTPGDTTLILGVLTGVIFGSNMYSSAAAAAAHKAPSAPATLEEGAGLAVRFVVGVVVLVLTRAILKSVVTPLVTAIVGPAYLTEEEARKEGIGADSGDNRHGATVDLSSPASATEKAASSSSGAAPGGGGMRQRRHIALAYEEGSKGEKESVAASGAGPLRISLPKGGVSTSDDSDATPTSASSAPASVSASASGSSPKGLVRIPPGRRYGVELPVKFIVYMGVGFNTSYTCLALFQLLPGPSGRDYGL
jgi:membrane-associated phospholipid phosphatase